MSTGKLTTLPIVDVQNLSKTFGKKPGIRAVRNVEFSVTQGQTFGLVGESGSGKSTTGRLILRLLEPTTGQVLIDGKDLARLPREELRRERQHMQMIFQDPYGSLNPWMTIDEIIQEPLLVHGLANPAERRQRAAQLLNEVGFSKTLLNRYPHEFSGGQRQRVAIARALVTEPRLIVADEPVSALDVSVQAQVLNLLRDLQAHHKMTMVFISHDLRVIEFMCDEIAVMYLGEIVERGPRDRIYQSPQHPYTRALLDSIPGHRKEHRPRLSGEVPSPAAVPSGCPFHTRCPLVFDRCRQDHPTLTLVAPGHLAACHLAESSNAHSPSVQS